MVSAAPSQQLPPGAGTLYVDHANHLTPLTLCYHATASRHLTSGRLDVIPPSTTAEVDSAYCPRSLAFCDAATASSGVHQKESGGCKDCPVCFSPVSISIDKNTSDPDISGRLVCHYLCGHCQWSSRECGVSSVADKLLEYASSREIDASQEKALEKQRGIIIAEASRELELCLRRRVDERNKEGDALFNSITNTWAQREQEEGRRKRMQLETISTKDGIDNLGQSWSMEKLKQSLLEKKRDLEKPPSLSPLSSWHLQRGNGEEGSGPAMDFVKAGDATDIPRTLPTPQQMAAQMILTTVTARDRSELFPLPVHYRARASRRCRAELAAGRTGILIKPKLNPLEGDTSLRAGHGQWWKKDSSAVHVVPRVQLCRYGADPVTHSYAVLLKVKNPTLNLMRLRLAGPVGPERENEDDAETAPLIHPRELEHILACPFTETFVKGRLSPPAATSALVPTEFFVLDSADDPYLDIGKGREEDPAAAREWDAASALGAPGDRTTSHMRVVATQGDTAWAELVLRHATGGEGAAEEGNDYLAVPLALQIEVGNGSWEASLIKRRDLPEEEKDLVTLNLVILVR